jgi:hypothetical protein
MTRPIDTPAVSRARRGAPRLVHVLVLALLAACTPVTPVAQPLPPTEPPHAPATPEPLPAAWADLAPQRAALRPEFAADLDSLTGATQYSITLTIAPDLASLQGEQLVFYTNNESVPLEVVYFRLFANTRPYGGRAAVTALTLDGAPVTPESELSGSALRVPLATPLAPGQAVEFALSWTTQVPTRTVSAGYNQFGLHQGVLTLPNAYPLIPAYDEEGWNVEAAPGYGDAVYSDTALYRVTIHAPAGQTLIASGNCTAEPGDAQQTWRCASGPMRDFAIMLSDRYQLASYDAGGVRVNSYYYADDAIRGQDVVTHTRAALASFEQRFGPYPFNELDLVETPTTAGGIEYPGLIVVTDDAYDRNQARYLEIVVAHEVAHQWFYSLVGNDQVDEPWLDEALAQYLTVLYFGDTYGAETGAQASELLLEQSYDRVRGEPDDRRADRPVAAYTSSQYSAIVYGKAALFFQAVHERMGDAAFNEALRDYVAAHRYGVAEGDDLLQALREQIDPARLETLLTQWITTPDR